jgi:hypothetical protein
VQVDADVLRKIIGDAASAIAVDDDRGESIDDDDELDDDRDGGE